MDASKMKAAQKLTADINRVAMKNGYQADFSALGEGKGVEFKMTVAFKKPTATPGEQMDLSEGSKAPKGQG